MFSLYKEVPIVEIGDTRQRRQKGEREIKLPFFSIKIYSRKTTSLFVAHAYNILLYNVLQNNKFIF